MKNLKFDDVDDFCEYLADAHEYLKGCNKDGITVMAKYDQIHDIIVELLCRGYKMTACDIESPECGYEDEYICDLHEDELYIEPFKRDTGYFQICSEITYVFGDCSSKVLDYIKEGRVYDVILADEDEEDTEIAEEEPEVKYYVNGRSVDAETAIKAFADVEDTMKRFDDILTVFENFFE